MAKVIQSSYAAKLKTAILKAAITGKLTGGTSGWKTVKLGEVCETCFDGDWIESKDQAPSGIRLIQTGNIGFGVYEDKSERAKYISEETFRRLNCTEIFPGDILISRLPSPVGRACILPNTNCRMITAVDCTIIRPKKTILPKYLVFYASSQIYFDLINEKVTGTTRSRISRRNLESIYLPLPPLTIQKEIVGKVEELMGHVKVVQEAEANIRRLSEKFRKSILDQAIHGTLVAQDPSEPPATIDSSVTTPPYPVPPNWKWVKLGEVCNYGKCSSTQASEIKDDAWSLDLEDIEKDTGKLLVKVRFGERRAKGTRHIFKKGQLLYSKLRTYLNKVLIADEDGVCTTEILPLDFTEEVLPAYARLVLMSQMALDYTANCGYGVKMPRLGTHDGKRMPFPLPPLGEQKRIVGKVEAMMKVLECLNAGV